MKIHRIISTGFLFGLLSLNTLAAECSWLPDFLCNLVGTSSPVTVIETRIRAAFFIAIGAIILIAIAYGLYNAYKYIKSGGGDGMEEASKGMRSILFGIGSIFVIILGIAAVLLFFGANFIDVTLAPTCISYPDGAGCYSCQNQKVGTVDPRPNKVACDLCNKSPNASTPDKKIVPKAGYKLYYDSTDDKVIDDSDAYSVSEITVKCSTLIKEVKN